MFHTENTELAVYAVLKGYRIADMNRSGRMVFYFQEVEALEELELSDTDVQALAKIGKEFVTNIRSRWERMTIEGKILYQGLIFPENLIWDGECYQTPVVLEVFKHLKQSNLDDVTPQGIEP